MNSYSSMCRRTREESSQTLEQPRQFFLLIFGNVAELVEDAADRGVAVIEERFFAGGSEGNVDLALVAGIDAAGDEGSVAGFQGADDARHLGRQHAEHALDVADDHHLMRMQ